MAFRETLARAVSEATGGVGAAFVDGEGETIEAVSARDRDTIRLIGAHHGIVLSLVRRAVEKVSDSDALHSLSIRAGEYLFSVVPVVDDTFLVLVQDRTGLTAQGIEVLTRAAAAVRAEI